MRDAIQNKPSPALTAAKSELEEREQALEQRKRELGAEYDKLPEADKKKTSRNAYVDKQAAELQKQVASAKMSVTNAVNSNITSQAPEHNWLHNLDWIINSRHYNYPYKDYIKNEVTRQLGIKIRLCEEDFNSLERILEQQTEAKWHTRCDWEWRLKKEVDGSIEQLPQLQKWLERARGPVIGDQ